MGTVDHLSLFVGASSKATALQLGLYADSGGHPGALLASGATSSPVAGAWNSVAVTGTPVTSGTTYWVAVLGTGGKLVFGMGTGSGVAAENSKATTLTTLPAAWTTGPKWTGGAPSFYASSAGGAPDPPADTRSRSGSGATS